jgi:galactose mutarotase-like enzyme
MVTIENAQLKAVINPKGAELTQLFHKDHQLDYLWNGDPAFWAKHSPILFPIVGTLKNNTYFYKGAAYQLPRHGFARDKQFVVNEQTGDTVTFLLQADDSTRSVFPFEFDFRIRYSLYKDSLAVTYEVVNTGQEAMYFSVGAHPAFKLPLVEGTEYTDYYLEFNQEEMAPRWPISKDGLIETTPLPLLEHTNKLPLSKSLFLKDALVMKGMASSIVNLRSNKTPHGFMFDYPGFPFMGIWAAKNADFVCIEPWCGIADPVNTSQQLEEKEGINTLAPEETFTRTWTVTMF